MARRLGEKTAPGWTRLVFGLIWGALAVWVLYVVGQTDGVVQGTGKTVLVALDVVLWLVALYAIVTALFGLAGRRDDAAAFRTVRDRSGDDTGGEDSPEAVALRSLARLRDDGLITGEEFAAKKAEILAKRWT